MQKRIIRAGCLLGLGLAAVSASPAQALRLGHLPNLTHGQALYARATGQFETELGAPIHWVAFHAGPTAIEALFSDAIDASFVGPTPAINGYIKTKGKKFVLVAGTASGGSGLVVRRDAGIRTARDFHRKTIATPQLGNTQDVAARLWFLEQGYRFKERGGSLTLVPLANPDQLTMFLKKHIHGAWTVEPWLSRLELEANGQLLLDERTLWPQGRYLTTGLIVNQRFLAAHPERVKKLLRALVLVTQAINRDQAAAGQVLNAELKKQTGKALKPEIVARALSRIEFTWQPMAASLHRAAEAAHRVGFLRQKPQLRGIYDLRPLNAALQDLRLPPVHE